MEVRLVDVADVKRLIGKAKKFLESDNMYDFRIGVTIQAVLISLGLWRDESEKHDD